MRSPTISAVVPAYNCERYLGEALSTILSQTRPPDEVIVVDDGSTDGTMDVLAGFSDEIRVVRQANCGVAGAMNRCYAEARGDYVAKCDADDVWELEKLQRQAESLRAHPEIDIGFGGAHFFGLVDGPRAPYPDDGILSRKTLAQRLYRGNFICNSTTVVRRRLFDELGPFDEQIDCEDYDYWLRALAAGAHFFHDGSTMVRYRAHPEQVSGALLRMHEAEYRTHRAHADLVKDTRVVRTTLARDLSNIARALSDQDRFSEARATFVSSLGRRPTLRALAWVIVLFLPERMTRPLANQLVSTKRALRSAFGRRASSHVPL